jgi:predicted RNA methylase
MNSPSEDVFANWHPHFTPPWLSRRLVDHVPSHFSGTVIDPACGAGNLLAATALKTAATYRPGEIHLAGTDISTRAVRACRDVLSRLLPHGNFHVLKRDFLRGSDYESPLSPSVVVMNPPFRGYGELSQDDRLRIRSSLQMKGRFNLGHAFVVRAIGVYAPERLIALLPSNWVYTRSGWFRDQLQELKGKWDWEDIGDGAFRDVDVHLGILVWSHTPRRGKSRQKISNGDGSTFAGLEVRQGVATGADDVFLNIAQCPNSIGAWRPAVKGRDVGRTSARQVWVPPAEFRREELTAFLENIPPSMLDRLSRRSCVRSKRRTVLEYHEAIPDWFFEKPKLLLPEIVTGELRVELDAEGSKMPLHSVIAVRVPSIATGKLLLAHLRSPRVQNRLLHAAPRLNGGAVRLQVGAVRDILSRWMVAQAKKSRRHRHRERDTVCRE